MTRLIRSRTALWVAFAVVHLWLIFVGVFYIRVSTFGDVDLYRRWAESGLLFGIWPGLDGSWVYPVGAWLPILIPAAVSITSPIAYALGWSALVTVLDAVTVRALSNASARDRLAGRAVAPADTSELDERPEWYADLPAGLDGMLGAWGWLAFVAALGPVALGRLDSIIAPLMVLALLAAFRHPRTASALLTAGAWIKVAPGALLIGLAAAAKRPIRDVVVPAAAVTAVVVAVTAAAGGLPFLTGFLGDQGSRGLQVEAVAATPWLLAGLFTHAVRIAYNPQIITFEITGPGTETAASVLNLVLVLVVAAVAVLLLVARRRGVDVLLPGALALAVTLIVTDKVGSPQYMTWIAPAVAVAIATRTPGPWFRIGWLMLGIGVATQIVYPWQYSHMLGGNPVVTLILAARNGALVVLLVMSLLMLVRAARQARAAAEVETGVRRMASATRA